MVKSGNFPELWNEFPFSLKKLSEHHVISDGYLPDKVKTEVYTIFPKTRI